MHSTPLVQNQVLLTPLADSAAIPLDSYAWYDWLERNTLFAFQSSHGKFTARKEPYQQGGEYWKAYRKHAGKLHRMYLGKSENLTYDCLRSAAALLTERLTHPQQVPTRWLPVMVEQVKPVLSAREQEILCLVEYGLPNKEIATHLFITLNTVKEHLKHIYLKLDVQNRTSAVNRARALGLLHF